MPQSKKPSSRITGFITGLDDFVLHRASRPLWIFGWTLCLGAVWFLVTFYASAAETQASLDRDRASIGARTTETNQVRRVYDVLLNAWSTVADAGNFYRKNLKGRSTADPLAKDLVSEGLKLSTHAREQLASAIGTISATRFSDAQLAAQSDGVREDLESADRTMAAFEEFFKTYSAGNADSAIHRLQELDKDLLGAQREGAAALTRAKAWPERADALMNDLIADTNLLLARQRTFTLKFYASILTALYVLGFLGLGFRVWQSTWKSAPPSQKKNKKPSGL